MEPDGVIEIDALFDKKAMVTADRLARMIGKRITKMHFDDEEGRLVITVEDGASITIEARSHFNLIC